MGKKEEGEAGEGRRCCGRLGSCATWSSVAGVTCESLKILENSTALFFTGFQRNAQNIEKKKLKNIFNISKYLDEILMLTDEAENHLYNSKNIITLMIIPMGMCFELILDRNH